MNLKELSARLGLSQTTVSRALNGYPEVAEATRVRVTEAAREFGYRPNPGAKALATGRTMAIGHVFAIDARHELVNPIFSDFLAGAGEIYARNGYDLRLTVVAEGDDEAHVYRELAQRRSVDGIVLAAPSPGDPRVAILRGLGMPFVMHGRTATDDPTISWVDVDNAQAFEDATEYLLGLGHRRIGLVNGRESLSLAMRRRSGYLAALARRSVALDAALMASGEMTEPTGHDLAARMLALEAPPTAFVVASMISGIGVRRAIEERGLTPGREVSVVIYDDVLGYLDNGSDAPIFAAVRSPVRQHGRLCAELLIDAIREPEAPPRQVLLPACLVPGRSAGPPAPARGDG
jgi:LacI family transcriptional regulator